MNRQDRLSLVLIFSVVLNVVLIGSLLWRNWSERPKFAYEEIGLTAEQRARFDAARDGFVQTVNRQGNQIIQKHVELIDLIAAPSVAQDAIARKLNEIRVHQQSMQEAVVKHLIEDKEILRSDQQSAFFEVLKKRMRSQGAPGPAWVPSGARKRE